MNRTAFSPGDSVLFKRGEVWREQIYPASSGVPGSPITFGAYGTGPKPLILGSLDLSSSSLWTQYSSGVWRTPIANMLDIGNLIFNMEESCGHKRFSLGALVNQGDYWWDDAGYLYLRSSSNPGIYYSHIEAAKSTSDYVHSGFRIQNKNYITVRDLDFRYQSNMGIYIDGNAIAGCRGIVIEYCDLSWIGGVNYQTDASPLRAGNGIFAWRNVHDLVVRYNTCDQIYDVGICTQGLLPGDSASNQYWHHNTVTNCNQGWEWGRHEGGTLSGIVVEDNTLVVGECWGYGQRPDPRSQGANFWTNSGTATACSFRRNYIDASAGDYVIQASNPNNSLSGWTFADNTYYPDDTNSFGEKRFIYGWTVWPNNPTSYDLAGWKARTGLDATSQVGGSVTPDTIPPTVPSGVTATATDSTSIRVSWTASTDASGIKNYLVYASDGTLKASATSTSATITGLAPQTTYTFYVKAVDNAGNTSAASATASATTYAPPDTTPPAAPTGVTAVATSPSAIRVSWNAASDPSGIKHYLVYMNDALAATVTGTSTTVAGLSAGTTYSFYIKAVDNAGNTSAASVTVSATTQPPDTTPPTAPAVVTATATSYNSVGVMWTDSSDASGIRYYLVYMDGALKATVTGTSATITQLVPQTTYSFYVKAVDNAGNTSADSPTVSVTTPLAPDTAGPTLTVTGVTSGTIYTAPVTISFSAADAGQGLASGYPYATLCGSPFTSGSTVSELGQHTLVVTARDRSGNVTTDTRVFNIVSKVRIEGANRIATAIAVSKTAFTSSEYVVLATAYNWPDALGGSALAGALDAPILLTADDALPAEVAAEIRRLGASRAIVLGGSSSISGGVEATLKTMLGAASVERIAGANRFETASMVAARTIAKLGAAYDGTAFVATGEKFPDAVSASPLSAAKGWPIYLTKASWGDNASIVAAMKAAGVTKVVILGDTNSVRTSVETRMRLLGTVTRLSGADRYDTALKVANYGITDAGLTFSKVAVATGEDYPDALTGGVLEGKSGSVMLLTRTKSLDSRVSAAIAANKPALKEVRFIGAVAPLSAKWPQ